MKLITPFILLFPLISFAQPNLTGDWTNGNEIYSVKKYNDSLYLFVGGNLHEGGSTFVLKLKKDNSLWLTTNPDQDYASEPSIGALNDRVEYRVVSNIPVLIVKDDNGGIKELLRQTKADETLWDIVITNKINFALAGVYTQPGTIKEYVFYTGEQKTMGFTASGKYDFETAYDFPLDIISFGGGKSYYYEVTDKGLDIFAARHGSDDEWAKGKKLMSLQKTTWFRVSGSTELKGASKKS